MHRREETNVWIFAMGGWCIALREREVLIRECTLQLGQLIWLFVLWVIKNWSLIGFHNNYQAKVIKGCDTLFNLFP